MCAETRTCGRAFFSSEAAWVQFQQSFDKIPMDPRAQTTVINRQGMRQHAMERQIDMLRRRADESDHANDLRSVAHEHRTDRIESFLKDWVPSVNGILEAMRSHQPLPAATTDTAPMVEPLLLADGSDRDTENQRYGGGNKRKLAEGSIKQEEDSDVECWERIPKRPYHHDAGVSSFASQNLSPPQPPQVTTETRQCPSDNFDQNQALVRPR